MADEAPVYQTGFLSIMICYAIGICSCFALRIFLVCQNKKRDRLNGEGVDGEDEDATRSFTDKTDKEEKTFRYAY